MEGPPGTGKTLLARALATEADVPFFAASGSEFVEMYAGLGAARVRELFREARDAAPCVLFIDEIDALGGQRKAHSSSSGDDEREQTLNQLLVEMDGFDQLAGQGGDFGGAQLAADGGGEEGAAGEEHGDGGVAAVGGDSVATSCGGVLVIAATNRAEVLDDALLRPGRFDRRVRVGLPNMEGREQILRVHASGKPLDSAVDLCLIARRTTGFSGAELASVLNEAAIGAAAAERAAIAPIDVDTALDKAVLGTKGTRARPLATQRRVAAHELGHALIGLLLEEHEPPLKVSLIPRAGGAAGTTVFVRCEEDVDSSLTSFR